ncbi:MAG: mechanosensitive ion channel family protein [Elainellaceae cyanobacterium]
MALLLTLTLVSPNQAQIPLEKIMQSSPAADTAADTAESTDALKDKAAEDETSVRDGATAGAADRDAVERAPVTLDGRKLFTVAGASNEAAWSRAEQITQVLQSYVKASPLPKISVKQAAGDVSILADSDVLLQVTEADGRLQESDADIPPDRLARQWVTDIRAALEQAQAQRTPEQLRRSLIFAGVALALAAAVYWWTRRFQERIASHLFEQVRDLVSGKASDPSLPQLLNLLAGIGLILTRIGLVVAAVVYAINRFPTVSGPAYTIGHRVLSSFTSSIFPLGDNAYSAVDLLILLVALVGIIVGARLLSNLLRSRVLGIAGLSSGSQAAIATLIRYTLIAIGSIVLLQVWGLDLSSLTLLASALGFGIGFGLQNIARDFSSGLVLLFERPIQVGDFVEVGEFIGTVNRIGARSTHIKTLSQISVIVPNSYFLENQVINWSHENPLSRISIPVGVSYSADPEMVREVLLEAGRAQSGVVKMPPPQVFFKGFGDSALDFELLVWIMEPNRHPLIKSDLYFMLFELLAQRKIEIPFPQRDLHIRTGTLPIELGSPDGMKQNRTLVEKIEPTH